MRPNLLVKLGLLAVVVITSAFVASPANSGSDGRPAVTSIEQWHEAEVARIQEHLAGAEEILLAADVSSLSPAQLAARTHNVELLRGYRERGVFPRNIHFAGSREPYFVDDRGVLCAMAYLIAKSGRNDIVERVRATQNNARIRDLAGDPTLIAWLANAGLTVDEAARVQPAYEDGGLIIVSDESISPSYAVASAGTGLANVAALAWNLRRPGASASRWGGALGILTGVTGIALGVPRIPDGGTASTLGSWNVAVGTLSALAGGHALLARSRARRATPPDVASQGRSLPSQDSRGHATVTIAPAVGSRSGLGLNVTF